MIKKRDYISASQISTFLECPLLYKKKYILWEKIYWGGWLEYMVYWTAIHSVLEKNYKQKILSRIDLPLKELLDYWRIKFKKELAKETKNFNEEIVNKLIKQWEKMITLYMRDIAPNNQPVSSEQEFEITSEKYWITIKWYIDLILEDWTIIDFKTVWESKVKQWSQSYVDNLIQLSMYSLAFRKTHWKSEKCLRIEALKGLKAWPKINIIDTYRSNRQIEQLSQLMRQMRKLIDLWLFYPNLTNCNTCDFKDNCNKLCLDEESISEEDMEEMVIVEEYNETIKIDLDFLLN